MYELHLLGSEAQAQRREFESGVIRLGRDRDQDIVVTGDHEVSRRHATFSVRDGAWVLSDQGSANGTFVNGARLEAGASRTLADRDRVTLGSSERTALVFRVRDDLPGSKLVLRGEGFTDDVPLDSILADTKDPEKLTRARDRLFVLYEASRAVLSRVEDLSELIDRLKLEVIRTLKVDEMIVALRDPASGELTYDVVNRRNRFRSTEIAGSKTIIQEVLGTGTAFRRHPTEGLDGAGDSTSIIRHHVRSVICVPLAAAGDVLGAIYVQNPEEAEDFAADDFDFLAAFARHVALAVREAFRRQASDRALEAMRRENVALRQGIDPADPLSTIVGASEAIEDVRRLVRAVKDLPSTVLIVGESGTGKELVAKALHFAGVRADHPFVSVNVAACPEGLLESELFGHERGSFTGASSRKIGRFEQAHTGTLFMDEIGELPPATQVKLLRVLQERVFERVGGTRPVSVDVRLIFATNRDLDQAVKEGRFREDFYYRVNVVRIALPALRDRKGDLAPLVDATVGRLKKRLGIEVTGLEPEALAVLAGHDFPGNVRELENILERAFIRIKIRGGTVIEARDMPFDLGRRSQDAADAGFAVPASYDQLKEVERDMVLQALRRTGGNKRRAAQELGITPQTLYNKIADFGLKPDLS